MSITLDTLLVLLILSNFILLGSSRLNACIRIGAMQGIMVGAAPLAVSVAGPTLRIALIGVVVMGLKGFMFPYLLSRALRESDTRREVQPFVGYTTSLVVGVLSLLASFWLDAKFDFPVHSTSNLIVPVAFFMMLTGLFLIVARRSAVNQVVGYLLLENGIYIFGMAIVPDIPIIIELGVLMDVFVAVFVMGIAIYHINREFDHINVDRLNTLKG